MTSAIKIVFIGFFLSLSVLTKAQSMKKIIADAWIYAGSWDSLWKAENIELTKDFTTDTICIISFEKGNYFASDAPRGHEEKGKWKIERMDGRSFIIVTLDSGQHIKFEIISASNNKLKLERRK